MMNLKLITLVGLLLASPALAQDACTPVSGAIDALDEVGGSGHIFLEGEQKKKALQLVNRVSKGLMDIESDLVFLSDGPEGVGFISIGKDKKVCQVFPVPPGAWPDVKKALAGTAA